LAARRDGNRNPVETTSKSRGREWKRCACSSR
jgi:hypothetical protein